jgi:hypothetical protein
MKTTRIFAAALLIVASGLALRDRCRLASSAANCSGMI